MIGELRRATCHRSRWQGKGVHGRSYRDGAVGARALSAQTLQVELASPESAHAKRSC